MPQTGYPHTDDGWVIRSRKLRDGVWMSESSELDRIGQSGKACAPHTCMWGCSCDWCFRQSLEAPAAARRGQFLPVVSFSYSLKWPGFVPQSVCLSVPHISMKILFHLYYCFKNWILRLDSYMSSLGPTLLWLLGSRFWPQCSPKHGKSISYFCF